MALSGGGDSLALTLAAAAWAKDAGRPLWVLTVDHGLRSESAGWTQACAATAARLGAGLQALTWIGEKPVTGLPAAARIARHALLADAARAAGCRVVLMGHTADDILEAARMRAAGSTTPTPREWAPSPAWPEGRGLFLLRPMLDLRRADIRAWLMARGERWIDDPANDDPRYARVRARRSDDLAEIEAPRRPSAARVLAEACEAEAWGGLRIDRAAFRSAPDEARAAFLAAACLCAAGTGRPPARAKTLALAARLAAPGAVVATLSGARVETAEGDIRILREAGEAARGGLAPLALRAGEASVWDGRFEVTADRDIVVRAAATREDLEPAFQDLPARIRRTLPAATGLSLARSLVQARLLDACGMTDREPG